MQQLPTGTVTFVFTDVEGSARLMQRLRDGWAEVHADHRRLLRAAFADAGGREVDTQGDAFFFAFGRARDAVAGAAAAQRALARHDWPEGASVRVRMGIHTGEPAVGDEGYLGLDVVRAARLSAAGHGGQVLLSETTRALVDPDDLDGVGLIDLGEHRLKDMRRRERIYQLVIAGLQTDFRPLRTEAAGDELAIAGAPADLGAQAEAAIRDFRAQIEQEVSESIRSDFQAARATLTTSEPEPPHRRQLTIAIPTGLVVVAAVVVYLIVR